MGIEVKFGSWLKTTAEIVDLITRDIQGLLSVLEREEELVVDHRISDYEAALETKDAVTRSLSENYNACFSAASDLIEICKIQNIEPISGETISSMLGTCNKLWQTVAPEISTFERKILDLLVKNLSVKIGTLLTIQAEIKPRVERNVILIGKLLESHRQSYLFWRELISRESSGYDSHGQKKKNHSLSYFVTKA